MNNTALRNALDPRSLIGMTQSHRKRLARAGKYPRQELYIGAHLILCVGCCMCRTKLITKKHMRQLGLSTIKPSGWLCNGHIMTPSSEQNILIQTRMHHGLHCSGSGVITSPARLPEVAFFIKLHIHRKWPIGVPELPVHNIDVDGRPIWRVTKDWISSYCVDAIFEILHRAPEAMVASRFIGISDFETPPQPQEPPA